MGLVELDPADAMNAQAISENWPFYCFSTLEFEQPELNLLRDVWFKKRGGGKIPLRSALDARALKPVLSHLTILERVKDGDRLRYRVRLTGSAIARLSGENTGRFLDEVIPAELLPRWTVPYDVVLKALRPLRFVSHFAFEKINYLDGESFIAPLLDADSKASIVMSVVYFKSRATGNSIAE
ncbi:MAG: PAS domain-containing protein [Proteobacteria bacterium]|nr:PAS domain-containing protein [Pseudomonadota bacterium]